MTNFWYHGPLPPDSHLFRGRERELQKVKDLCQGELRSYLLIFGGRQIGKTSLLYRAYHFLGEQYLVCRIDLQKLTGAKPEQVYGYIANQLETLIEQDESIPSELDSVQLSRFVLKVAGKIHQDKLVLLFEELGSLPPRTVLALANLLRSWFNERFDRGRQAFGRVMVIVAGSVELYKPAAIVNVSPLSNISQVIHMPDLSASEVTELIAQGLENLGLPPELPRQLGEAVYKLVGGYPYLVQRLGGELEERSRTERISVDIVPRIGYSAVIDGFLIQHLRHSLEELKLLTAISPLLSRKVNFSRLDKDMAQLELLGLAVEGEGVWIVRNALFEQILTEWLGITSSLTPINDNNAKRKEKTSVTPNYNLGAIRELLLAAFTTEDLKRLCFDNPRFRPVYDEFSSGMGKTDVVDRIMEFGQNNSLITELLQVVKLQNPRQFANFEAKLHLTDGAIPPPPPASLSKMPQPQPAPTPSELSLPTSWARLKLQVAELTNLEFTLQAFDTPIGEIRAKGKLPYDGISLIVVLKALHSGNYDPAAFSEAQNEMLQALGLLHGSRFVADILSRIGQSLYQALFLGKVGSALDMALNQVRPQRGVVGLQLRFDADAVNLARYPWELLHDGNRALLSSGAIELTRYITYTEAPTPLTQSPPWRLLYITARPANVDTLPLDQESQLVRDSLQPLATEGHLILESLTPATYDQLLDELSARDYHIIHFDGHGVFGKKCPKCEAMNQSHLEECAICQDSLVDVQPGGFLAFEDGDGRVDYVDTSALENALFGNQVRLAVISSCVSATVRGETLFSGVGPGLIRAGIPAVVAMQLPIQVKSATNFAKGFYTALTKGESIPRAVAQGRRRLYREGSYFIPTLYLRSTDDEGKLFII